LRLAAGSNPLIDQSILKSRPGIAALDALTRSPFNARTIDPYSLIEQSKKKFNRNTETTLDAKGGEIA
jgi:hypothetical protein